MMLVSIFANVILILRTIEDRQRKSVDFFLQNYSIELFCKLWFMC